MAITSSNFFTDMISTAHLFQCWDDFKRGKRKRKDIQWFERFLEDNIFHLHADLKNFHYQHQPYEDFYITDPKERFISKATVRDRLVHHVVHDAILELFDHQFIYHSLASRTGKGIHFGVDHLRRMIRKASANGTKACYALKMDIRRFFDTVDHEILKKLLQKQVHDERVLQLIAIIIDSFSKEGQRTGLPLGNVTSQLFANVYLHELDLFIKHTLREKYYLRYCDDFIILANDEGHLQSLISPIAAFLKDSLYLTLHPHKIQLRKLGQGIDFIGYVLFSHHTLLRGRTKHRIKRRLQDTYQAFLEGKVNVKTMDQQLQSYLGILSHANEHQFAQALRNGFWVRCQEAKDP